MTQILSYEDASGEVRGWLAYDSASAPLAAGGCRMQPGLSAGELSALASAMTLKQRVLGLNVTGAKCGIDYDPRAPGAQEALGGFLAFLHDELHRRFSMGSDMGTRWDTLQRLAAARGIPSIKYAVKKAQRLTDEDFFARMACLEDRVGLLTLSQRRAGHVLTHAAIGAARAAGVNGPVRVALQGFGTLGRAAAHGFLDENVPVVAVADEHGCVADPHGLDLARMLATEPGTPVPRLVPDRVRPQRESLFTAEADVLVLAAGADALTVQAADRLPCPAVAVGANYGLAESAEQALHERGVLVVPDFIGGIGGSASMELLFGPARPPAAEQVLAGSARLARRLVDDLFATARRHATTPRRAALRLAARTEADADAPAYGRCPYLTAGGART
ncbi:Glu/Leu/Phe/Val dehydrogenase dimerization domain-containing protein [Streptomyces sp. NPDC005573]|uniref:Glu/Leu/Phe/Val dehydrogenase dimerization domain-containing protein n=1 Tax=Streptomyces sp. NPDC005573 TaxID=3156890 RepID=UPI0033B1C10D